MPVGIERIVKKVHWNIYPCFGALCLDMKLLNRCFHHFFRKSAIEKDPTLNFFSSKMKVKVPGLVVGWLELKKCSPYRLFSIACQRW